MSQARAMISDVTGWEALDSRGRPTVAARVTMHNGAVGTATVPSGASAGSHEAHELRDGGSRYAGRGVRRAVEHVNEVIRAVIMETAAEAVDDRLRELDPTPGFNHIGANALLAVSVAAQRAAAAAHGVSLARYLQPDGPLRIPMPMVNVISGGAHAGGLVDFQDYLVIPMAATNFSEAIEWAAAIRDATAQVAEGRGLAGARLVADEGGIGVPLTSNRAAVELLIDGIADAGFTPGEQIGIALDLAATQLVTDRGYELGTEGRTLTADQMITEIADWCVDFPILSVEDLLAEDDWDNWVQARHRLPAATQLLGDDLFATQPDRVERGITMCAADAVLIKVNQNGLVSGARTVLAAAHDAGLQTVVSARSGDTEDSWLSDFAVGWGADQIKVGSTHRSERTAKWNRLLELEATETTELARPWPRPSTPGLGTPRSTTTRKSYPPVELCSQTEPRC